MTLANVRINLPHDWTPQPGLKTKRQLQVCANCGMVAGAHRVEPVQVRPVRQQGEVTVLLCRRCRKDPLRWLRWVPVEAS